MVRAAINLIASKPSPRRSYGKYREMEPGVLIFSFCFILYPIEIKNFNLKLVKLLEMS